MAYRGLQGTRERIQAKCGKEINVILNYSEPSAPAPAPVEEKEAEVPAPAEEAPVQAEEPSAEETPAEAETPEESPSVQMQSVSERTDEQKNLIEDILICFDGREERG